MHKVLILNGPNLSQLGKRDKVKYGELNLEQIKSEFQNEFKDQVRHVDWSYSESESDLISKIHNSIDIYQGLIINPGALSHSSLAIADALEIFSCPKIEVHLTHIHSRSYFRRELITARSVDAVISGMGIDSYKIAFLALVKLMQRK